MIIQAPSLSEGDYSKIANLIDCSNLPEVEVFSRANALERAYVDHLQPEFTVEDAKDAAQKSFFLGAKLMIALSIENPSNNAKCYMGSDRVCALANISRPQLFRLLKVMKRCGEVTHIHLVLYDSGDKHTANCYHCPPPLAKMLINFRQRLEGESGINKTNRDSTYLRLANEVLHDELGGQAVIEKKMRRYKYKLQNPTSESQITSATDKVMRLVAIGNHDGNGHEVQMQAAMAMAKSFPLYHEDVLRFLRSQIENALKIKEGK